MTALRRSASVLASRSLWQAYKKMRAGSTPFTGWFCTWAGVTLHDCMRREFTQSTGRTSLKGGGGSHES